ncbi:hypothetical protein CGCVW01_v012967, partial [Colletotrichum viniferum]
SVCKPKSYNLRAIGHFRELEAESRFLIGQVGPIPAILRGPHHRGRASSLPLDNPQAFAGSSFQVPVRFRIFADQGRVSSSQNCRLSQTARFLLDLG